MSEEHRSLRDARVLPAPKPSDMSPRIAWLAEQPRPLLAAALAVLRKQNHAYAAFYMRTSNQQIAGTLIHEESQSGFKVEELMGSLADGVHFIIDRWVAAAIGRDDAWEHERRVSQERVHPSLREHYEREFLVTMVEVRNNKQPVHRPTPAGDSAVLMQMQIEKERMMTAEWDRRMQGKYGSSVGDGTIEG